MSCQKFKAGLETACCADIDHALPDPKPDCYDFFRSVLHGGLCDANSFGPLSDSPGCSGTQGSFRFSRLDFKVMKENQSLYNSLWHHPPQRREMELEYTQPEAGQKMV